MKLLYWNALYVALTVLSLVMVIRLDYAWD